MKPVPSTALVALGACAIIWLFGIALSATGTGTSDASLPTYTPDELARHDRVDSCWIAVEGLVYDVTSFLPLHPAPPAVVVPWCGRDGAEGMRTKGYGNDHSPAAWAMLDDYLIGVLEKD